MADYIIDSATVETTTRLPDGESRTRTKNAVQHDYSDSVSGNGGEQKWTQLNF